jgi:muconate cycloisomerase
MKIGADGLDQDLQRVRSVAQTIPGGVNLSLDANQALSFDGAMNLCAGIGDLPVSFVEQPFAPQAWDLTADLATATSVPIMMDESIWHAEDIARASAVGAKFVKLKLCKHRGAKDTLAMIALASDQGLGVVLGNGVQSSLGNHLEAKIYETANLSTAGEFNGFAKFDSPWMPDGMSVENGALVDGGIDPSSVSQPTDQKIFQIDLPT